MPKDKRAKDTLFHRIPTCNAHLKQLSRIKKHKISSAVLRKSNRIWNESARWIGCCAVMLATEKPRWRFALHSKPNRHLGFSVANITAQQPRWRFALHSKPLPME